MMIKGLQSRFKIADRSIIPSRTTTRCTEIGGDWTLNKRKSRKHDIITYISNNSQYCFQYISQDILSYILSYTLSYKPELSGCNLSSNSKCKCSFSLVWLFSFFQNIAWGILCYWQNCWCETGVEVRGDNFPGSRGQFRLWSYTLLWVFIAVSLKPKFSGGTQSTTQGPFWLLFNGYGNALLNFMWMCHQSNDLIQRYKTSC